jgi:hypothetical protein
MIALALSLLAAGADAPPVDFAKIPRTIAKTPTFTSKKPLYALFLFGEKHDARVWAVLDQGRADKPDYDVLYLDLEGDGDLTQPTNRIVGKEPETRDEATGAEKPYQFEVDRLDVGGQKHRAFALIAAGPSFSYQLSWEGKRTWYGPYGLDYEHRAKLAESPEKAPILVPGGAGPFQFELSSGEALVRGDADTVQLLIGNVGSERGAFSTTSNDLLPKNDYVVVELVYTDKDNKQKSFLAELRERC